MTVAGIGIMNTTLVPKMRGETIHQMAGEPSSILDPRGRSLRSLSQTRAIAPTCERSAPLAAVMGQSATPSAGAPPRTQRVTARVAGARTCSSGTSRRRSHHTIGKRRGLRRSRSRSGRPRSRENGSRDAQTSSSPSTDAKERLLRDPGLRSHDALTKTLTRKVRKQHGRSPSRSRVVSVIRRLWSADCPTRSSTSACSPLPSGARSG